MGCPRAALHLGVVNDLALCAVPHKAQADFSQTAPAMQCPSANRLVVISLESPLLQGNGSNNTLNGGYLNAALNAGKLWHRDNLPCWLSLLQLIRNLPFWISLMLSTGQHPAISSSVLFQGPSMENCTGPGIFCRMTGNSTKAGGPVTVRGKKSLPLKDQSLVAVNETKCSLACKNNGAVRAVRKTRSRYNQIGPLDHKMANICAFLACRSTDFSTTKLN